MIRRSRRNAAKLCDWGGYSMFENNIDDLLADDFLAEIFEGEDASIDNVNEYSDTDLGELFTDPDDV